MIFCSPSKTLDRDQINLIDRLPYLRKKPNKCRLYRSQGINICSRANVLNIRYIVVFAFTGLFQPRPITI